MAGSLTPGLVTRLVGVPQLPTVVTELCVASLTATAQLGTLSTAIGYHCIAEGIQWCNVRLPPHCWLNRSMTLKKLTAASVWFKSHKKKADVFGDKPVFQKWHTRVFNIQETVWVIIQYSKTDSEWFSSLSDAALPRKITQKTWCHFLHWHLQPGLVSMLNKINKAGGPVFKKGWISV